MNKTIYILLLFCTFFANAQTEIDSSVVVPHTVVQPQEIIYRQKEFKEDFKKKYQEEEFIYETKPKIKTKWDRIRESVAEFLNGLFRFNEGAEKATNIVFRIIMFLIIGFVIYLIVRAILNKESMWIFGRSHKKIGMQSLTEEDIHLMDFTKVIEKTKNDQDYKLAIRYYYLWLLKKLSERHVISWHQDKTNSDYSYEITDANLKKDYEYLSYIYEYSWYGDFTIDELAFGKAEKAFQKTINTL